MPSIILQKTQAPPDRQSKPLIGLCSVLLFMPILIISMTVVNEGLRDNENYLDFYDNPSLFSLNFFEAATLFKLSTGASEPLSFSLFYIFATAGISYSIFIFLKNFLLIYLLGQLLQKRFRTCNIWIIYAFYLATDYYLFRLLSEVHRLGIAVIFIVGALIYIKRVRITDTLIAILSHFQIIIAAPLLLLFSRSKLLSFIILFLLSPFLYVLTIDKIYYYLNFDLSDLLKFSTASAIFLFLSMFVGKKLTKVIFGISLFLLPSVLLFGTDRTLIVFFEIVIFTFFIYWSNLPLLSKKFLPFGVFLVLFVIPYNIFKIILELSLLKSSLSFNFI